MFWVLFSLFILFLFWRVYLSVIKPYLLIQWYKKKLADSKYNVHWWTFMPYGCSYVLEAMRDFSRYKDVYYKLKRIEEIDKDKIRDISAGNFGNKVMFILRSPQLIKQLFSLDGTNLLIKQQQFIKNMKRIVGQSITFSQGEKWKHKRKSITSFLNFTYVSGKIPKIVEISERTIQEFSEGKQKFSLKLLQFCQTITSEVIIQLFFGGGRTKAHELEIKGVKLGKYARMLMEDIGSQSLSPLALLFGQDFAKWGLRKKDRQVSSRIATFNEYMKNFILDRIEDIKSGHKNESNCEDYVQKMYNRFGEGDLTQQYITDMISDFSTLFVAGSDTTSRTMMMLLYVVSMHPEVVSKLKGEIDTYIKCDEDITYETFKKMKYVDAVLDELTRYFQPADGILIRQATQDLVLGELPVKKGTIFMVDSVANHYISEYFDHPHNFDPERWLPREGKTFAPQPYTHLTFSAGPRSCIGKQLAQLEMKVAMVKVFRNFDLHLSTTDLEMNFDGFLYQPQPLTTTFTATHQ